MNRKENFSSIHLFLDSMAFPTIQLIAAKCPTDELTFSNCAIINEKDIDPSRIR